MQILNITRWPFALLLLGISATAVAFTFISFNLFSVGMANIHFIRSAGWDAIRYGALWQLAEILLNGAMALLCWLAFRLLETEVSLRYRTWADRARSGDAAPPRPRLPRRRRQG